MKKLTINRIGATLVKLLRPKAIKKDVPNKSVVAVKARFFMSLALV
ncbi:MAG: hypothetical protein ABJB21_08450 [bacterium]